MTKAEFQKLSGLTAPRVRKLCDRGTFTVKGLGTFKATKTGTAKTSPIDIQLVGDQNAAPPEVRTDPQAVINAGRSSKLKEAKMSVEIQLLQQKLLENRADIERLYSTTIINELLNILEPLKTAFRECKLTNEQKNTIDCAISESLERCRQRLNQ